MVERRKPGVIRDAIISTFQTEKRELSVSELRMAVSKKLGEEVPASSVRSYLNINTPDSSYVVSVGTTGWCAVEEGLGVRPSRALAGDCLAWLKKRAEKSIHAVVTDPPYGLHEYTELQQEKLRSGKGGVWRIPPSFDGHQRAPLPRFTTLSPDDLEYLGTFFLNWAKVLRPALVPGAHVIVACNPLVSPYVSMALSQAGLERRGEIVRLTQTMRGGDRPKNAHEEFNDVSVMARSQWEPWLVYREPIETKTVADNLRKWKTGGLRRISEDQPFGDVIRSSPTGRFERNLAHHPSLKPQHFLRQVVRASLPLGEGVVLDPFAGSGSTLAAAEAVGYYSIGVEMDLKYLNVAKTAIPALSKMSRGTDLD